MFTNLRRVLGAVILAFNPLSRAQVTKILKIKPSLITANVRYHHSVLVPQRGFEGNTHLSQIIPRIPARSWMLSPLEVLHFLSPIQYGPGIWMTGVTEGVEMKSLRSARLRDEPECARCSRIPETQGGGGSRYLCASWPMNVQSSPLRDGNAARLLTLWPSF